MTPKYTIRTLFVVVSISAVCALMLRTSDWLAALGFGVAAIIVLGAANVPTVIHHPGLSRLFRYSLFLVASGMAWLSIVDYSHWYEWCPKCSDHRFINQLRICGLPIASTHGPFHIDNRSRIRNDLGMPCSHEFEREHLVRVWGLAVPARPRIGITCCLSGDPEYYDDDVARRTKRFAIDNPHAARELCNNIVNADDFDAMHAFIAKMKEPEAK